MSLSPSDLFDYMNLAVSHLDLHLAKKTLKLISAMVTQVANIMCTINHIKSNTDHEQ